MAAFALDTLKAVQTAFGPCTVLYEAMEDRELVEDAAEFPSLDRWIATRLRVEAVFAERNGGNATAEDVAEIRRRLKAAGLPRGYYRKEG